MWGTGFSSAGLYLIKCEVSASEVYEIKTEITNFSTLFLGERQEHVRDEGQDRDQA